MMKRMPLTIIMLLLLIPAARSGSAQSLDAFRERLAEPVISEATGRNAMVTVTEHGDAATAAAQAAGQNQRVRFKGYRVCIFFDNSQNARARAVEAKELLVEHFPETPVHMVYENPYFKVSAGDCVTSEEAIILQGRLRGLFPKAFIVREEMTVADLLLN